MIKNTVTLGEIKITGNRLMVSDPIYQTGVWCQAIVSNVKSGTFVGQVLRKEVIYKGSKLGEYNEELTAIHKDHLGSKISWKSVAAYKVGVDSTRVGIYDMSSFNGGDKDWILFQERMIKNSVGGAILNGVVAQSGLGDGEYNVYVAEKDGQVIGIKVKFLY